MLIVHDRSDQVGGAEIYCARIRQGLRERGHEAAWAACELGPPGERMADFEYPDTRGKSKLSRSIADFYNPVAVRAFRHILNEFKPDIVHLRTFSQLSVSALNVLAHTPTVYTPPGFYMVCPTSKRMIAPGVVCHHVQGLRCVLAGCQSPVLLPLIWMRRRWIPVYTRNVNLAIGQSTCMVEELRRAGFPWVEKLLHGVPVKTPLTRTPGDQVLYVGRLTPEKGVDVLLRAIALLHRDYPGLRLVVAGDGPSRPALTQLAGDLGLAGVVDFLGWVPNAEVPQLHARSKALVVPSLWPEAFGIVTAEAQAFGTPVVGTALGGTLDLIRHGETGLLCRPADAEDMAAQLAFILDDPRAAKLMADEARRFVEANCSLDVHLDRLLDLYRALLAEDEPRPSPKEQG